MTAILHALTTARRTDGRGSVRCTRWYRVVTAHDEILYSAAGEPMEKGIVIEGFNLEVEDRFLGLGTKDAIDAHVATMPGFEVVDFWPLSSPPADEI